MPTTRNPRYGSMQFWPRSQTKRTVARIRNWQGDDSKVLGFQGYKAGMTHIMITDNKKTSLTKGEEIFCPVTVIECPPLKVAGIRFYKNSAYGSVAVSDVYSGNLDKELARKITLPKKKTKTADDIKEFDDLRLIVYSQPKLTPLGRKKPDMFEIGLGGKKEDKLKHAKDLLGKEISVKDVFKEGQQVDINGITRAKGLQGPVRRFGVSLRHHKSEKVRRGPGSLGGWKGQGHTMYRVAHAGRMGFHQRTEYNKWLMKIGNEPKEINPNGGFVHYGLVNNPYILIKGSVPGIVKRTVILTFPRRETTKIPSEAPAITYISLESKQ